MIFLNLAVCYPIDSDMDGTDDSEDTYPYDFDNDGMPDMWEKKNGLNFQINDGKKDFDGDGIKNIDEYLSGTSPKESDAGGKIVYVKEPKEYPSPTGDSSKTWLWVIIALFLGVMFFVYIIYKKRAIKGKPNK